MKSERDHFQFQGSDEEPNEIEILEVVGLDVDAPAPSLDEPEPEETPQDEAVVTDRDRLVRLHADFENYKKRVQREQDETERMAASRMMKTLLPILDNFERAVGSSGPCKTQDSLLEGVELIFRQLLEALRREGLEAIDAVGELFDPEYHEAVATDEESGFPPHIVIEELQRGYKINDRVIRPSLVKVAVDGKGL